MGDRPQEQPPGSPKEACSAPPCWHTSSVSLHTDLSLQISPVCPCPLVLGAQASPQGGGCLQAQARLTESKAWEGDLCETWL